MRSAFAARMYAAVQLSSQQQMYVPFKKKKQEKENLHTHTHMTLHTHTHKTNNALYLGTKLLLFIYYYYYCYCFFLWGKWRKKNLQKPFHNILHSPYKCNFFYFLFCNIRKYVFKHKKMNIRDLSTNINI